MPELPEVEILVRHLRPLLHGKIVQSVEVRREKSLAGTTRRQLTKALRGARFVGLERRGKYLLFSLRQPRQLEPFILVGHLGMTGRMYLLPPKAELPKHTAVVLHFSKAKFVFEDTRYFGRLTLDQRSVHKLGAEPLDVTFTAAQLAEALKRSSQPIKIKLLDQSLLAGVGNIYASEALFRAKIPPTSPAARLTAEQVTNLWRAVREVLAEAIAGGSTVALNFGEAAETDRLFYFGRARNAASSYEERLQVYDRMGQPCIRCTTPLRRLIQAGRSTFYCPTCQSRRAAKNRRG